MKISKIPGMGSLGIYIDNVDFNTIEPGEWMEIGRLQVENLVTVIRNANLSYDLYPSFIRRFGDIRYNNVLTLQRKYQRSAAELVQDVLNNGPIMSVTDKNIMRLGIDSYVSATGGGGMQTMAVGFNEQGSALGWFPDGDLSWHIDEPGLVDFITGASLYGVRNMVGSATAFINTVDAYQNFSNAFRSELDQMLVENEFTAERSIPGSQHQTSIDAIGMASVPNPDNAIPLVIQSPGGHQGLHYSPCTAKRIQGATEKESRKIFQQIEKEIFKKKYLFEHWYQQDNDLILYDNTVLIHRRIASPSGRTVYRIAFDYYTSITKKFYQPYHLHPKMARKHIHRISESIRLAGITDFNRPGIVDYLKTFI